MSPKKGTLSIGNIWKYIFQPFIFRLYMSNFPGSTTLFAAWCPYPAKQAPELEPSQEPSTEELLTWERIGQGQHPWDSYVGWCSLVWKNIPPRLGDSIPIIIYIYIYHDIYHTSGKKIWCMFKSLEKKSSNKTMQKYILTIDNIVT